MHIRTNIWQHMKLFMLSLRLPAADRKSLGYPCLRTGVRPTCTNPARRGESSDFGEGFFSVP